MHTHCLKELIQDGMSLFHLLLLECLCKMFKSDSGAVRPQVRLDAGPIHQLNTLIHKEE